MFMIQTPSIKTFLAYSSCVFTGMIVLCMLPVVGITQQRELSWPKTFSGQPDFVFEREEAIKEIIQKAREEGSSVPEMAVIDPLLLPIDSNLAPLQQRQINPRGEVISQENEALVPLTQGINAASLPDVLENELLDISEFKAVLENAAETAVRKAQINTKNYDFSPYLARLTLQAVVTSPHKYAVINERRYTAGDRLHINVPVILTLEDIEQALNAHMPPENVLSQERESQYKDVKSKVLSEYKTKIAAGGVRRQQRLALRVQEIESRRVVLSIGGKQYDLAIKFAL